MRSSLVAAALLALTAACAGTSSAPSEASSELSNARTGPRGPTGPTGPTGATGATGPTADTLLTQSWSRLHGQREVTRGDDGSLSQAWITPFWDSKLGFECMRATAGDGQQRCLPVGRVPTVNFFADAGCTVPIGAVYVATYDGGSDPLVPYVQSGYFGSSQPVRLYRLGARYDGPLFLLSYQQPSSWDAGTADGGGAGDGGTTQCISTSPSYPLELYRLGDEVSPSEFVRFTVTRTR